MRDCDERWLESIKQEAIRYRGNGEMHKQNFTPKIVLLLIKTIDGLKEKLNNKNDEIKTLQNIIRSTTPEDVYR